VIIINWDYLEGLTPPTLGLGGSLSCEVDPRLAGLREKSVLGPYGPRDGLFRCNLSLS
jgi:hypothetical protein